MSRICSVLEHFILRSSFLDLKLQIVNRWAVLDGSAMTETTCGPWPSSKNQFNI